MGVKLSRGGLQSWRLTSTVRSGGKKTQVSCLYRTMLTSRFVTTSAEKQNKTKKAKKQRKIFNINVFTEVDTMTRKSSYQY